jgi:hypothetical protein
VSLACDLGHGKWGAVTFNGVTSYALQCEQSRPLAFISFMNSMLILKKADVNLLP